MTILESDDVASGMGRTFIVVRQVIPGQVAAR
jgi:hypothetical protein